MSSFHGKKSFSNSGHGRLLFVIILNFTLVSVFLLLNLIIYCSYDWTWKLHVVQPFNDSPWQFSHCTCGYWGKWDSSYRFFISLFTNFSSFSFPNRLSVISLFVWIRDSDKDDNREGLLGWNYLAWGRWACAYEVAICSQWRRPLSDSCYGILLLLFFFYSIMVFSISMLSNPVLGLRFTMHIKPFLICLIRWIG